MGKTTLMRIIWHNFMRVWTTNVELSSGVNSGLRTTLVSLRLAETTTAETHVLNGLSTQFGKGGKHFSKLGSLVTISSRGSLLPGAILQHPVNILHRPYSSTPLSDACGVVQIELAQTGEGIADCELLRWFVQEGEDVEEFQPLCEVQSDKASVEITSRYKGRVSQVKFTPGDIVKVGETLLELIIERENSLSTPVPNSSGDCEAKELSSDSSIESPLSGEQGKKGILATPAIRNLAKISGVNLANVTGSGLNGRILECDILPRLGVTDKMGLDTTDQESGSHSEIHDRERKGQNVLSEEDPVGDNISVAVKPVVKDLSGSDKIIPVRGFRRIMAKIMTAAVSVPHFHYTEDINVDALVQLKDSLKNVPLEQGVKLTYLPFLLKALSIALQKYPLMNSTVNDDVSEITVRASHNIGVGMATCSGLVVPNIKNVQQLSVLEIAEELSRLTQLAATNRLSNEDVTGGTITVSNFGSIGGKYGSPVLSVPEVAIVAIGRIQKLPRFAEDGSVYPASIMGVTWGADHRVVDGATVASFCNQWKLLIEQPSRFLLNMR